ncbi:MAG: UDP-N-acetylmuramate--L-alanine ligase, partial [Acidimicrobiales bacterium]
LKASPATDALRAIGVEVAIGHDAANVGDVDMVAVSTAIPKRNVEVVTANGRSIPVLRRSELLAAICGTRRAVAVAGTHGKTTTSSMLALVMLEAGMRPSFIIGGQVNEIGSGAAWNDGEWFVVEADESDGTFLELGAEAAIVTSVEADHLDYFGSVEAVIEAFDRFLEAVQGPTVVSADDPEAARLAEAHGALTYGFADTADYRIVDLVSGRAGCAFAVEHMGQTLGRVEMPVAGAHNAANACAAAAMAHELGADFDAAVRALARFGGVARRFEFRGERDGITFVDDYAHNPGKVRAVLASARQGGWERLVCVFQPHLYSRTADLAGEFGSSFDDADVIIVTDVYGQREQPIPGVSGRLIVDAIKAHNPEKLIVWLPERRRLAAQVKELLQPGDLCLTLGAGDLTLLPDEIAEIDVS